MELLDLKGQFKVGLSMFKMVTFNQRHKKIRSSKQHGMCIRQGTESAKALRQEPA